MEKDSHQVDVAGIQDLETIEEKGDDFTVLAGDVVDALKTTADGKIVLIPQPTDSPQDPLNWSWTHKHLVLASIILPSFLTDFGITYGAPLFFEQAGTFHMSVSAVANSISGGIFLQGPGGLLAVPLTQRFGRLPVLFWSQLLACACAVGAALSPTYACFTAFRTLQGFFDTPPQVIGLTIIHDMFFFHERARKIGIWVVTILVGPSFGPFMASLIASRLGWRQNLGIMAAMYFASWIIICIIGEETHYERQNPSQAPRTVLGRISALTGWHGARVTGRQSIVSGLWDIALVNVRPHILLTTTCYFMIVFGWTIGFSTTAAQFLLPPPYSFSAIHLGLFYLAPQIGCLIGEAWGHWFNDWLVARYIRTHNGQYRPEDRLWGCYPSLILCTVALILWGQALAHQLSWVALAFAWGIYTAGQVSMNVAICAYCLDTCPKHSTIVAEIINMWRTTFGFCVVYFQLDWVKRVGAGASFGTQAAILVVSFTSIVAVQVWGKGWRGKFGLPRSKES